MSTPPKTSTKSYNTTTPTPKRKHKAAKVKTKEFIELKRTQTKEAKQCKRKNCLSSSPAPSSKKQKQQELSTTVSPLPSPSTQNRSSLLPNNPSNHQSTMITSFLTKEKQASTTSIPIEDYFKVPIVTQGFNIASLRHQHHFSTLKIKPNIIAVMMKTILNNNVIPWQASTTKKTKNRISERRQKQHCTKIQSTLNAVVNDNDSNHLATIFPFSPQTCMHRCYVEDFILLPKESQIVILLPKMSPI